MLMRPRRLSRYVAREVVHALLPVLGLLLVIFASFDAARLLAGSRELILDATVLLQLVLLKAAIALDVLLPLALYLAVVLALGRLHHDREVIAARALGLGDGLLLRGVLAVALVVALAVTLLAVYGRPWAYAQVYALEAAQGAEFELDALAPGQFRENPDTGRLVHLRARGPDGQRGFLLYERENGVTHLVLAERARQPRAPDGEPRIELERAAVYALDRNAGDDRISTFRESTLLLERPERLVGYRRKAAPTAALLASSRPDDIAARQWRLSRPLATLLLAILAIPLSAAGPRRGRHGRVFTAMLAFALLFILTDMARSWVEQQYVGAMPGIWWSPALMALLTAALWMRRQ